MMLNNSRIFSSPSQDNSNFEAIKFCHVQNLYVFIYSPLVSQRKKWFIFNFLFHSHDIVVNVKIDRKIVFSIFPSFFFSFASMKEFCNYFLHLKSIFFYMMSMFVSFIKHIHIKTTMYLLHTKTTTTATILTFYEHVRCFQTFFFSNGTCFRLI